MKKLPLFAFGVCCAMGMAMVHAAFADTELDYVEATGSQWVDTGIVGRHDIKVEIKAEWLSLNGDTTLLACRGNAGTDSRINFMNSSNIDYSGRGVVGWGYGTFARSEWQEEKSGRSHYRFWELGRVYTVVGEYTNSVGGTSCKITVDGMTSIDMLMDAIPSTGCNLTLFGNNVAGNVIGLATARCYGLKIWQKPEAGGDYALVRDLRPVLKDGRAGFHDAVSGDYFYSATGKELVAGTEANQPDCIVDYVESTGSEYVDLGVIGKSGVTMESRMSWTVIPDDGSYVASRKGGDTRFYLYHHYQKDTIGYGNYYQCGVVASPGVVQNVRCVLKNGEQKLTVDDVVRKSMTTSSDVNTGYSLYLFACNKDGSPQYKSKARCYSLKLWEGESLVRDFRPCLKRGSGALYDQVSGKIFRAGAGTLRTGRLPVAGKPDYFVNYIASKGDNYFDTGIRARNDTRAAGDFQLTNSKRNVEEERYGYFGVPLKHEERTVLGACASGGGSRYYFCHMPNAQYWIGYGDLKFYPSTYTTDATGAVWEARCELYTSRHTFDVALEDGRQSVVLDGKEICVSNATGSVDAGCNLYVFACNSGGTANYLVNARLYSLQIWQKPETGGDYVLVRNYRPCMKNGMAGLYDEVNDQVVYPVNFIPKDCIGSVVYTDDMKPVEVLEYVDSNCSQWVDTGVTGRVDTVAEFTMAWLNSGADPDVGFLGSRQNSGDTRFYMWHDAHNSQSFAYGDFRYINGLDETSPNWRDDPNHIPIVEGEVLHVKTSFLANGQTIFVNGRKALNVAYGDNLNTGYPMYLFAYNNYGSAACKCAARLYSLKIWQDGKLVRNFLPVRLDCGLNALYDKVGQKCYPSLGAEFTSWGPSIGEFLLNKGMHLLVR